jgi:Cu-processing system ATP-binding protein
MIEIRNLHKRFGKLQVLHDVNLVLGKGECIALIGPNACGKTTLIKSILGMVVPTSGSITVLGEAVKNSYAYRRNIGYMPQIGRYPDNMTIGQVIAMVKEIRAENEELDEALLERFHLKPLFNKRMRTLSGGTTQKVSAVLAFLFGAEILILDEPTAGLDPLAAEILKEKILEEKKKGKLILITSHLLNELDDLVTQIIFMQEGQVKFHTTIDELRARTGEARISKAIAHVLKGNGHE